MSGIDKTHPELIKEWDYDKNGELSPDLISYGATKKIWWKCKEGHSWQATPNDRTSRGNGCPYCSNRKALPGETDLITVRPDLAKEWNYRKIKRNYPDLFMNK